MVETVVVLVGIDVELVINRFENMKIFSFSKFIVGNDVLLSKPKFELRLESWDLGVESWELKVKS